MKTKIALVLLAMTAVTAASATIPDDDRLIAALARVESHDKSNALGDRQMKDRAYGCLQIRKPCVDDINRRFGTKIRPEDCFGNRSLSVWVCQKYLEMYATRERLGREPAMEDAARIWNGGPNGWRIKSTLPYWSKVKKALARTHS